ncbi:MAG TPA: transaldolase [Chloroflexi bacterium]|nr:transaldolase [Chloroflexota bacterium]
MALYLDSAIMQEAEEAAQTGWIYGITTNPILLGRSQFTPDETLRKLSALPVQEVYYQVKSSDLTKMRSEINLAQDILGEKLVVKIPPTALGFRFAAEISAGFKTCITAIYSPAQALVAKETGSQYIAVYVNRATRLLGDGIEMTRSIAEVLAGSQTQVLAASLKSTQEAVAAFKAGANHLSLPLNILKALIADPLSAQAVEEFDQSGAHL